MRKRILMLVTSAVLVAQTLSLAQQAPKPMTNDDVITLVHNKKVPESVIVSEIKSRPSKFNTSTNEIIRLTNAGVTENELNAIIAASNKSSSSAASAKAPGNSGASSASAGAIPTSKSRMPKLYAMQSGGAQELPLEKTQLAETKTKPSSMKSLAADSAVTQAM